MDEKRQKLVQKLAESHAFLDNVLAQVGDRWDVQVYDDGEQWTVRQVLVHLADSNRGLLANMQRIASGEGAGVPDDFDIQRYNERVKKKMDSTTVNEARASLAATDTALLAWLNTVDDSALEREGRHPTQGVQSVYRFIRIMAIHELGHASDIARALGIPLSQAAQDASARMNAAVNPAPSPTPNA